MPTARAAPARAALVLAGALLAAGAHADDGDVRLRLVLHGRFVDFANQPEPVLRLDRAARAFDLRPYLRPEGVDRYLSTFAAAAVDGRHGWFRWGLTLDTGQLRSQSFPQLSTACFSSLSPTGVDVLGSGRCNVTLAGRRPLYDVEDTRQAPAELTSNGRSFADELSATLLVREAWVGAAVGRNDFAVVKAGRKRFTVGDGFVYDDYGLGLEASFDLGALGPSFDLGAALFYPTRDFPRAAGGWGSPMLALRADWLPSLFEHAGIFLALYRDRTGSVAELFRGSFAEPSVVALQRATPGSPAFVQEERALVAIVGSARESDARLGWVGTSGSLAPLRGTRLEWTGALCLGEITIGLPDAGVQSDSSVFGQLAHVAMRTSVGRDVELGGFFLYLSGDLPPTQKARLGLPERYGGFLGIAPYVTLTNIFFNGGVAETFAARQATAPGVNGRGVIAPGLTASWDPLRSVGLDLRAAWLFADESGPFGGRSYGPEVDLEVSWSPLEWLRFALEADALVPGNFFPGGDPVTKVVLGVDVVGP